MPNETGIDGGGSVSVETCGRCGAQVGSDAELCSACGALLSAYRTPVVTADEVAVEVGGGSTSADAVRTEPLPRVPFRLPAEQQPVLESKPATGVDLPSDLAEARTELLTSMLGPERRLVNAMQSDASPASPVIPPVTPVPTIPKPSAVVPGPVSASPAKPAGSRRVANRPTKPGFVAIGSIEPVVVIGSAIFAIAVIVGLVSSLGDFRYGSTVALVLGTVGIVTIVFAMLVALVRKDQDRR